MTGSAEQACAAALAGDRASLEHVLGDLDAGRLSVPALGVRTSVLLAHRAATADPPIPLPRSFRSLRAGTAARWVLIERSLRHLGAALDGAGVPWAPIKGADVATRSDPGIYPDPAVRSMTDVDLLVHENDYRTARRALEDAGWTNTAPGERFDRFVAEEGSAWTAEHPDFLLPVELHLRMWGLVPTGLGDALLDRAAVDPSLGSSARRLRPADAFLLAAVHPWTHLPPRRLAVWWEVQAMLAAGREELVSEAAHTIAEAGLHLPGVLSADRVESLWGGDHAAALREALAPGLRTAERAVVRRIRRTVEPGAADTLSIELLVLARLLSRRPSRSGLRPIGRRVWAHPGIVERLTPDRWIWPRRRLVHVLQCLKVLRAPRADWWRAPTHGERAVGGDGG